MSQAADLTAGEAEIIRILRVLHSHSDKLVVIGGYAVSALASHRFSVDCDVVVSEKELESLGKVLTDEGYRKVKATNLRGTHGAKKAKYVKMIGGRRVAVDLYANSVLSRDTGGEWRYELLLQNSIESSVVGVTDSTVALVPKRELLIAMKLHAARDTDLRDIVMLSEGADLNAVAGFANTGVTDKVTSQLDFVMKKIGSKEFPPALKAEFGLRTDMTPLIRGTLEHLKKVRKRLIEK